jgi:mRNA-degrading endonuclease YafQ of YafQ-DinJ toxin-antitoxin module
MPAVASPIQALEARLAPLQDQLKRHPLYGRIRTLEDLQIFMESHIFAVWDFMSLLKALQRELTGVHVPWTPTPNPAARRFINAIVLDEESDQYEGRTASHFELYVEAMQECRADTRPIHRLLQDLAQGSDVELALQSSEAPAAAQAFVASTFAVIAEATPHAIASAFTFGREDIIPDMFRELVRDLDHQLSGKLKKFVWYLERHIELDGDDHGPLALRMIEDLCGDNVQHWPEAAEAAETALQARIALWDGILAQIERDQKG